MKLNDILIVFACKEEENNLFSKFNDMIVFTGVGKVNATYVLTKKLNELKHIGKMPKIIINIGTVGSNRYEVGKLLYCNKFIQYDMNATKFGYDFGITPSDKFKLIIEHKQLFNDLPNVICGTGDCFEPSKELSKLVDIADMEAYSLAKVCKLENIDFFALKYISNSFDSKLNDWDEEAKKCAKLSFEYIVNKLDK